MQPSLRLFRDLSEKYDRHEFFVSRQVFLHVLQTRTAASDGLARLNRPQESPKYRYVHAATLAGMTFFYVSTEMLPEEGVLCST
jgi:hypothetical protein